MSNERQVDAVNELENKKNLKKSRIWEIDFLRGIFILLMIMEHMFVCVAFYYGPTWFMMADKPDGLLKFFDASVFYIDHPIHIAIHLIVVCLFIFICGLSSYFSRNNLKRGAGLLIISMAITLVTYFLKDIDAYITFGILHNLSFNILIWAIITIFTKNDKKKNLTIGLTISLTISILFLASTVNTNFKEKLGDFFYILTETDATMSKSPGDFFPIIPWSAMFFLGASLCPYLYPDKTSLLQKADGKWNKPICFVGRHTLIIYLLHIFLICGILELVTYSSYGQWTFLT